MTSYRPRSRRLFIQINEIKTELASEVIYYTLYLGTVKKSTLL